MPTYEYECSAGHRYEKREGYDAPPTQRCARCRRMARRLFHAPPIVFKGSGFYVTDSRKAAPTATDGSAPAGESESKAEPTSDKSDSKPESSSPKKGSKKNAEPSPKADSSAAKAAAS